MFAFIKSEWWFIWCRCCQKVRSLLCQIRLVSVPVPLLSLLHGSPPTVLSINKAEKRPQIDLQNVISQSSTRGRWLSMLFANPYNIAYHTRPKLLEKNSWNKYISSLSWNQSKRSRNAYIKVLKLIDPLHPIPLVYGRGRIVAGRNYAS